MKHESQTPQSEDPTPAPRQKWPRWAKALAASMALCVGTPVGCGVTMMGGHLVSSALSESGDIARGFVEAHPAVSRDTGSPVETSVRSASTHIRSGTAYRKWGYQVTGPKGEGFAEVDMMKIDDTWRVTDARWVSKGKTWRLHAPGILQGLSVLDSVRARALSALDGVQARALPEPSANEIALACYGDVP